MAWDEHIQRYEVQFFATGRAVMSLPRKGVNGEQFQCAAVLTPSISASPAKKQNTHVC